jgi:hypothetical protein
VRTFYYWDGYQLAQTDYSAFDRNRLLWRAEARGDTIGFHGDAAYLHSYRYFFALDAKSGRLRWAYAHPRVDMVSADDVGPVLLFASADGEVGAVDAKTGAVRLRQKTGLRLAGATFDAEGFEGGAVTETPSVLGTLQQIVWDRDSRFTAVKIYAVTAIGTLAVKDASAALLKVVLAPSGLPPSVQKRAGDELVARKDKDAVPLYLSALAVHEDFLEDKHPHGVDVLARALTALGVKEAVPELARHLTDPATPAPALKEITAALVALGGKEAVHALGEFLMTYRADASFLADPSPLTLAAEGLLALGAVEERRTVKFVAADARTLPPVARYLQKAMAPRPSASK